MTVTSPNNDNDLHLPRILCLHGGGTNSDIFRAQLRTFVRLLPDFRLIFADAPFFCDAGPGVVPVYQDYGPFRRWLRFNPDHGAVDDDTAVDEIAYVIAKAKKDDRGTGEVVGLIGFSQGAKMAASLLYDQQVNGSRGPTEKYRFAVLMAGRSPLVSLSDETKGPAMANAGGKPEDHVFSGVSDHILRLPTIHVHGLEDPGLDLHRKLLSQYCDRESSSLFEWKGNHRVPFRTDDVVPIVDEIYRIARQQGVDV